MSVLYKYIKVSIICKNTYVSYACVTRNALRVMRSVFCAGPYLGGGSL